MDAAGAVVHVVVVRVASSVDVAADPADARTGLANRRRTVWRQPRGQSVHQLETPRVRSRRGRAGRHAARRRDGHEPYRRRRDRAQLLCARSDSDARVVATPDGGAGYRRVAKSGVDFQSRAGAGSDSYATRRAHRAAAPARDGGGVAFAARAGCAVVDRAGCAAAVSDGAASRAGAGVAHADRGRTARVVRGDRLPDGSGGAR